ncbi:MAG: hypothetical protein CMP81_08845 [Fulvimarina sp.]|nr:hypothetical protein [Fulvimarina sp.]
MFFKAGSRPAPVIGGEIRRFSPQICRAGGAAAKAGVAAVPGATKKGAPAGGRPLRSSMSLRPQIE